MKVYHFVNRTRTDTIGEYVVFVDDEEAMNPNEWGYTEYELEQEGEIPDNVLPSRFPTNRILVVE